MKARLLSEGEALALGLMKPGERLFLEAHEIKAAECARSELWTVLRAIGRAQTGRPVDDHWCRDAARKLGEAATFVVDWSIDHENIPEALCAVLKLAKEQLRDDTRSRDDREIPF
jgi:hypothetical protein